MKYTILYLEDQTADTMVADFAIKNVELIVNKAKTEREAVEAMHQQDFDAYLMDYRLSQGKSFFDAPAFAAYLRTEHRREKNSQKPIVMITSEKWLKIVKNGGVGQNLFDMILLKDDYNKKKDETTALILSYIEAYREIEKNNYKVENALDLTKAQVQEFLDSRLVKELTTAKEEKSIFKFLKQIHEHLFNNPGVLIDKNYLASRLGINIKTSGEEWDKLNSELSDSIYSGVLSDVYGRWWMPSIQSWWNDISKGKSLRRMEAEERVKLLNEKFALNLKAATPIKECESSNFWVVCKALKEPLDPAEGYVCNNRYMMPWEENEYISLIGALEYTDYQKYLSEEDKREVRAYGKEK